MPKTKGTNVPENDNDSGGAWSGWLSWVALQNLQHSHTAEALPSQSQDSPHYWKDLSCYYNALLTDTQVSKGHILEPLSCLLLCLSSALSSNNFDCLDLCAISICIRGIQLEVKLEDIRLLHHLLFQELFDQLKIIFAAVNHSSENFASSDDKHSPCHRGTHDIILLLRCSTRILPLLEFDTGLSHSATKRLASLFGRLCSPSLVHKILKSKETPSGGFGFVVTHEVSCCTDGSTVSFASSKEKVEIRGCSQPGLSGSYHYQGIRSVVDCMSAMLEVFVDELILHPNLGEAFLYEGMESTGLVSRFKTPSIFGKHIEYSLEAVFVHCLLLLSQGKLSDTFLCKLFDLNMGHARSVSMSLPAAVLLLDSLVLIRAPRVFLAHVLALVSEAVAVDTIPTYGELPIELSLSLHVSVFESAVKLYKKYSSHLDTNDDCDRLENPALESCLIRYRSLQDEIDSSADSVISLMWNDKDFMHQHNFCSFQQNSSTKTNGGHLDNLLKSLCMYIREHKASLYDLSRNQISVILQNIVIKAFSEVGKRDMLSSAQMNVHPGTFLVAAILQLMGSSLSRIVCITKEKGHSAHSSPLNQYLLQAYYDHTIDLVVNCIGQCPSMQPIGVALNKVMAQMLVKNKQSVGPVVSYFVSELYLKFQMGSELLCKGYLSVLKSLMNLLVLEHGGIDILTALMKSPELSADSSDSSTEFSVTQADKSRQEPRALSIPPRVLPVVVNYFKKRQQHSVSCIQSLRHSKEETTVMGVDLSQSAIKSGKDHRSNAFVQSVMKIQTGHTDSGSDLNDFIVCKDGKDYSTWLEKRRKIRKKKYDKEFFQRMRRRKELLALLSGGDVMSHM